MRVFLFVTPTLISYRVFLRPVANRLRQELGGWEVHVATSSEYAHPEDDTEDPSHLHEVDLPRGLNLWRYARAAIRLRELVRRLQPAIVHAHFQPAVFTTALAGGARWPCTLGTYHGLVHTTLRPGLRRWLYGQAERWGASQMKGLWMLTQDDVQAIPLPNVHLLPSWGLGADLNVFDPHRFGVRHRLEKRQQLGIPPEALVFVYVGRQTHFKGFPQTALAALTIVEERPQVHFVLVGTGDPRHPDGLNAEQRTRLQEHPQIHLLGWEKDVASLLQACDCFVFPSIREGMAVCIMEALVMGLPVVTTNARGCGELVQHGHNGWIVNQDTLQLTQQLRHICDHPEEITQRGATALAEREKFSRERFIDEQLKIYRQYLGQV